MHGSRRRGLGTEQPGDGHWDGTTVRETGGTRRPQVLPPGKATAPVSDPPHAHLREGPQGRSVLDQAHHDREADAGEAATDQGRVEATPAPATPGTGHVAEEGPPGRLQGHLNHYAVPGNWTAIRQFRTQINRHWLRSLRRRSQRGRRLTWAKMNEYINRWIPPVRILH